MIMVRKITVLVFIGLIFGILSSKTASAQDDILQWTGKSIMVFAPHPDDELFCMGTLAKLVKAGNTVRLVIYTNGNKGSNDPDMTSERLAAIRKKEDIAANKIIGIPPENLINLGYDDGELEYVPQKELVEKVCKIIRTYRPDAVFGYDPGLKYTRWHKSDHRMAAGGTWTFVLKTAAFSCDARRASRTVVGLVVFPIIPCLPLQPGGAATA